ncbi:unnamed protein product [Parajaminaea phylloscopi]
MSGLANPRRDKLEVGTRVTLVQDVDLRGHITISSGTVVHPKVSILALGGPIKIGSNCIIEEHVTIINRSQLPAKIGDGNLFEVGARVECRLIGDHNVFEIKSRVGPGVSIGSHCTVSAGCTVQSKEATVSQDELAAVLSTDSDDEGEERAGTNATRMSRQASSTYPIPEEPEDDSIGADGGQAETDKESIEAIPDHSIIFGSGPHKRRLWSGEGAGQDAALHAKHLDYLRQSIPRVHKLRVVV